VDEQTEDKVKLNLNWRHAVKEETVPPTVGGYCPCNNPVQ